jgi:hypothetical protein
MGTQLTWYSIGEGFLIQIKVVQKELIGVNRAIEFIS